MTDQTIHDVTDDERRLARKWAEDIVTGLSNPRMRAAARVILDAVPTPTPPTLADMSGPESYACRWMQADVMNHSECYVIADPHGDDGSAIMVSPNGDLVRFPAPWITPRPDLPRMAWPGDAPTGPDDLAVGTVIESADDHRIDALPVGSILLDRDEAATMKRPWEWEGEGYIPIPYEGDKFAPWTVLHIPKEKE